jgi:hypothetical protein
LTIKTSTQTHTDAAAALEQARTVLAGAKEQQANASAEVVRIKSLAATGDQKAMSKIAEVMGALAGHESAVKAFEHDVRQAIERENTTRALALREEVSSGAVDGLLTQDEIDGMWSKLARDVDRQHHAILAKLDAHKNAIQGMASRVETADKVLGPSTTQRVSWDGALRSATSKAMSVTIDGVTHHVSYPSQDSHKSVGLSYDRYEASKVEALKAARAAEAVAARNEYDQYAATLPEKTNHKR